LNAWDTPDEAPDPTPAEGPDPYGSPDPEWLGVDWRENLRTAEVDGARVNYVEMGAPTAPPLVFLHGLSGAWQNWLENIPHFSRAYRVLAPDLPGFGASPMPPWRISIPAYADFIHRFLDQAGVEECPVVGSSMGGFIAAEAAIGSPGRFPKLALVSAAGVSSARLRSRPTEVAARMLAAAAPYAIKARARTFKRPGARELAFANVVRRPLDLRPELLWEVFEGGLGDRGFVDALASLAGYDFLDRLEEVETPTLIVWGREDRIVPSADAPEFGRRLRNSSTVIFGECGHLPMAERPVRFNRVLETFLSGE
jgi:pimeloyl-ACP methyl ester carboxylesterase